ncbi:hypothetical protein [Lysobacter brunescens]|uniref:Uncharacterized protein n=1 Tax=Lysobacter brunescens TaxID=262323 RepID=A0ABW2YD43_9GAMM
MNPSTKEWSDKEMGAISTFIKGLDPKNDVERDLKETMAILVKLAQQKLNGFKLEMNDSWNTANSESLAPGVTKDFVDEQMHVMTSVDSKQLADSIGSIVDAGFALNQDEKSKAVGTFIKSLASVGLQTVLGSGSAEENEHKQYIIYPDKDFLCRCDVWFWRYTMQSSGFESKLQHVVVYRMQYGAVDISKVQPVALAHWFNKWNIDPAVIKPALEGALALVDGRRPAAPVANRVPMIEARGLR